MLSSGLVGLALASGVQFGIAVLIAALYGPLVLLNLQLGIVLWTPLVFLNALQALDVGPTVAAMLILFAWFGTLAASRRRVADMLYGKGRLLALAAALALWVVLSMAWARESPLGSEAFFGWISASAILLVLVTSMTSLRHLRLLAGAFVLGAVASVAIGLAGGGFQSTATATDIAQEEVRAVGGSGDPNSLAAGIVPAILLAAGLAAGTRRAIVRWSAAGGVGLLAAGLAASQSRGGLVAAMVAIVAAFLLGRRQRAWILAFVLCAVGVCIAWFLVNPDGWERISEIDSSGTGRTELWSVATDMWQDHPLVGVGLDGFKAESGRYARQPGSLEFSELIAERPHVAHNTFLQVLAETGLVGFFLYAGVVIACIGGAWRAAWRFESSGEAGMAALSRAVVAAAVSFLTAAFFISAATDRRLWILLAMGPALLMAARRADPGRGGGRQTPRDLSLAPP